MEECERSFLFCLCLIWADGHGDEGAAAVPVACVHHTQSPVQFMMFWAVIRRLTVSRPSRPPSSGPNP